MVVILCEAVNRKVEAADQISCVLDSGGSDDTCLVGGENHIVLEKFAVLLQKHGAASRKDKDQLTVPFYKRKPVLKLQWVRSSKTAANVDQSPFQQAAGLNEYWPGRDTLTLSLSTLSQGQPLPANCNVHVTDM
jgi:hypothetical protein